jgi:hypothetical protein
MNITYNAGESWNKELWIYWPEDYYTGQPQDFIADKNGHKIAVEFKATDLHKSCFGKGIGGNLDNELRTNYLGKFDEVWIFIAGPQETLDIQYVLSLAHRYRQYNVAVKWFGNQTNAVKSLNQCLHEAPVDVSLPAYVNESDAPTTRERMIRQFDGFSENKIQELREYCIDPCSMQEYFDIVEDFCREFGYDNLARLWHDCYYGGIEPKANTLSKKEG